MRIAAFLPDRHFNSFECRKTASSKSPRAKAFDTFSRITGFKRSLGKAIALLSRTKSWLVADLFPFGGDHHPTIRSVEAGSGREQAIGPQPFPRSGPVRF